MFTLTGAKNTFVSPKVYVWVYVCKNAQGHEGCLVEPKGFWVSITIGGAGIGTGQWDGKQEVDGATGKRRVCV